MTFIGNGSVAMANAFKQDFDVRSALYTDPTLEVYARAGMRRGITSVWKAAKNLPRALRAGHIQGLTKGDALQQGGVLVVDGEGAVVFRHNSDVAGDHPDLERVIDAIPAKRA